jgi:hypothetical protein
MTPAEIALTVSTIILAAASFYNHKAIKKQSETIKKLADTTASLTDTTDKIKKATRMK